MQRYVPYEIVFRHYLRLFSSALGATSNREATYPMYDSQQEKLAQQIKNGYKFNRLPIGEDDIKMIYKGNEDFRTKMDCI